MKVLKGCSCNLGPLIVDRVGVLQLLSPWAVNSFRDFRFQDVLSTNTIVLLVLKGSTKITNVTLLDILLGPVHARQSPPRQPPSVASQTCLPSDRQARRRWMGSIFEG